ncbi:MAG: hypothetical protein K8U57_39960 [Planctomycetes bacterium]|nr:hypothetical protein [Planctomycetota bacterium]
MLGVMVASLLTLLVSIGGLGATGYYLFANIAGSGDAAAGRASNRSTPTNPVRTTPPPVQTPADPVNELPPKKETFNLKPVTGTIPAITAPELVADSTTIDLDPLGGRVGAISVGGGGRYIVMHFPDKGMLNVFDVSEGRFLGGVETDKGDVKLVAGISWVITSPSGNNLRVFTLPNLQRRYDATVDLFAGINAIAMGNRTDGPLLVSNSFGEIALLNIGTTNLREVEGARKKPGIVPANIRATPDGTAFLSYAHTLDQFPQTRNAKVLTESNRDWVVTNLVDAAVTTPGPDGNFYGSCSPPLDRNGQQLPTAARMGVAPGRTWFIPQITRMSELPLTQQGYVVRAITTMRLVQQPVPPPVQPAPQPQPAVPAVPQPGAKPVMEPAQAVSQADAASVVQPVTPPVMPPTQPVQPVRQYKPTLMVSIHTGGNTLAIVPNTPMISNLPEFDGLFEPNGMPKPILDQHFFLVPEAKLLVILSGDRTKLILRKINLP